MTNFIVVFVTTASKSEAENLAQILLDQQLIACANIIESVKSFFIWEKKKQTETECLLIIKTHKRVLDEVISSIKNKHSYQIPEIIAFPVVGGSSEYLNWIESVVR